MLKLLFRGMLALAISCVVASCAGDELADVPTNEMKEVTLTTRLDVSSRSTSVGEGYELFYTVYDAADGSVVEKNTAGMQAISFEGNTSVTLTLQLEPSKTYDIAFWAQPKGLECYDLTDLQAIKLRYDRCRSNDPLREAYYGSLFGLRAQVHQQGITVPLKSPFSKLEVLTTTEDVEAAATMGYVMDEMQSAIRVSGVADTFNALYGKVVGEAVTATMQPGTIPTDVRHIDGIEYRLLASDYLLAYRQQTVDVEVELSHTDIEKQPLSFTAGRAWLRRAETCTLANRYLTHPIEFDVTVNDWVADADLDM